jgi:1-acyl-sn-glycerol-3-phosphate acyltransferase
MRYPRAVWRLVRLLAHLLHGLAIMALRFPAFSDAERHVAVQWWSRKLLLILGVVFHQQGDACPGPSLIASNHVSWLDIACLHAACAKARFVSKSDVLRWPVLGWMIRNAGSIFIERERKRDALRVVHQIAAALRDGHTVAVFPEGTTGTGPQLEPFHANLLQAAISSGMPVQPVAMRYSEGGARFSDAVPYIGDETLVGSMWKIACAEGLAVHLGFLAPLASQGADRRALSAELRRAIQVALDAG